MAVLGVSKLDRRIWVLAAARLVVTAGFSMVMPFLAIHLTQDRGFSAISVGLIWTVSGLVGAAFQWIAGELADRMGRRPLLLWALALRAALFVVMGHEIQIHAGIVTIGALAVANAVLRGLFDPVCSATVADLTDPERRVAAFSLQRVGINIGWALGTAVPAAAAILVPGGIDYATLFYASAPLSLLALGALLRLPETLGPCARSAKVRLRDLLAFREDRAFMRFLGGTLAHFLLQVQLYQAMGIYAARTLHLDKGQIGLLFTLNGILVVLLQLPAADWIERFGTRRALVVGALGYSLGYAAFGIAHSHLALMACVTVITLAEITIAPAQQTSATLMAPPDRMGAYSGLYGLAQVAGQSLGPLLGTALLDSIPDRWAWPLLALLGVVAAAAYRGVWYHARPR